MEYLKRLIDKIWKMVAGGDVASAEETSIEAQTKPDSGDYAPEDIIIKFRKAPGEEPIDLTHDFCHIPTEEEIKREFGPGSYTIYAREGGKGRPKQKRRFTIEGNPLIPVRTYEVRVRIKEGGKLLNPSITFPGPKIPARENIINSLGGGGLVKLNAIDSDGKVVWSEWFDYTDEAPSPELARQEESFEGRVRQTIEKKREEAEEAVLAGIGGERQETSKFDEVVKKLTETLEDKKFERLEGAIVKFGDRLANPGSDDSGKEVGLTELAFKKPYEMKAELQKEIISALAKTDPEKAMAMLEKTPDGITMLLKLGTAASGLLDMGAEYFKMEIGEKKGGKSKERGTGGKGEKKEEGAATTSSKGGLKEKVGEKSKLEVEETEEDGGFSMKFGLKKEKESA